MFRAQKTQGGGVMGGSLFYRQCRQMMVFRSLVLVLIGQFCRDLIGRQNVKVVVIVCWFRLRSCMSRL